MQSPINLLRPLGSYGLAYGKFTAMSEDNFQKSYKDVTDRTKINWDNHRVTVKLDEQDHSWFKSDVAVSKFGATTNTFKATQFHIHMPSEHTINGINYDMELQIYHEPNVTTGQKGKKEAVSLAAFSLLFSVKDFDQDITREQNETVTRFIEHLRFDSLDQPEVDFISFGQLMSMVQLEKRWAYKGSLTVPPCTPGVYWNVVDRVLPIRL